MENENKTLAELRDAAVTRLQELAVKDSSEGLTDEEGVEFDETESRVLDLNIRIERTNRVAGIDKPELRSIITDQAPAGGTANISDNGLSMRDRDPGHHGIGPGKSWFRDMVRASRGDTEAHRRMAETSAWTVGEMARSDDPEKRALSAGTATAGGELVPPIYLQNLFAEKREAAAVVAQLANQQPLPDVGVSVTVPIMDGSTTAASHSENASLSNTDATFTHATASVVEAAGMQTLSLFVVERSAPGADAVILDNLARRVAISIDTASITAITGQSGIKTATYTDASPTLPEVYPKIGDVIQQIHTAYFDAGGLKVVVHPRRWGKWITEADTSNRPYMTPYSPYNPLASMPTNGAAQGPVGDMLGYGIHTDANITITNGASTNEDIILVGDFSQLWLWLSIPMFEVSRDAAFDHAQLQVRARQYYAVTAGVYPAAFGKVTGTGLATPTF